MKQQQQQQQLGHRISIYGYLLLFSVLVTYCVDLLVLEIIGQRIVPLNAYLISIFVGVAMQIVGAAVPNMRFAKAHKKS